MMRTNDLARTAWVIPMARRTYWRMGRYMRSGEHVEVIRHVDANTVIVRTDGGHSRLHPDMLEQV